MNDEHPSEPLEDPYPGLVAGLDQMLAMAGEMARVTRGFYDAFVAEGFSQRQALWLALAYIKETDPPSEGD